MAHKKRKREESEADVLNRLEKKAMKGKATGRELRILAEAYAAYGVSPPNKLLRLLTG